MTNYTQLYKEDRNLIEELLKKGYSFTDIANEIKKDRTTISRNIGSLYRVMRKLGYYKQINIKGTSKYVLKLYDTPKQLGLK